MFIATLIKGHLKTKYFKKIEKINIFFLVRKKNVLVQSLLFKELELKPEPVKNGTAPQHC